MYQRAIYPQYSDHKFGFLSDFPCVHELWFMFKFFSLLYQIICLQGRWVDWRDTVIFGTEIWKMSAFVIIYKADIGELCVHYIVLKLLAQKNLAFIHRDGMEHLLIPTLSIAYQEDRWRKKFRKKLCKTYFFFPKISLLHMDFLLHSLVTLETCLRSLHCNILCWTEQCSCQQMRVGPAPWGFQYLVSGCLSIKNHLYLHTLFLHILHIYPEEGFLKVQEAYGIFRLRNMEMGEKNFMPLSIKIFPCFLRAKKFEL